MSACFGRPVGKFFTAALLSVALVSLLKFLYSKEEYIGRYTLVAISLNDVVIERKCLYSKPLVICLLKCNNVKNE